MLQNFTLTITNFFQNQTRGLMGNWTFDIQDDFTLPDGREGALLDTSDIERAHKDYAMECEWQNS